MLDDVRAELVRLWGRLGPFWGIPPTTARVYGYLLTRTEAAGGDEIAAGLEMSRGGVSMACRELADWGLVLSERPPGSRRIRYRVEEDPEKVVTGIVRTRKRREWDPILAGVQAWSEALRKDRSGEARVLRERLAEIEGLVGVVDSMAASFLEGELAPRLGLKALIGAARRKARKGRAGRGAR